MRGLEYPVLIRRPRLPDLPEGWHTKVKIYSWRIPKQFQPKGHQLLAFIWVHVYDSEKAMFDHYRKLAKKWVHRVGTPDFAGTVVLCPRLKRKKSKVTLSTIKPYAEMFLFRPTLCSEYIAHESVHAAASYLRAILWSRGKKSELKLSACGGYAREERLAYLTGHFAGSIQRELVKHRIWNGKP